MANSERQIDKDNKILRDFEKDGLERERNEPSKRARCVVL